MSGHPLRNKALQVLRENRLQLLRVECRKTAHLVDEVIARVMSSREGGAAYAVDFLGGVWDCTCPAQRGRPAGTHATCAHAAATQMVTGHCPAELLAATA